MHAAMHQNHVQFRGASRKLAPIETPSAPLRAQPSPMPQHPPRQFVIHGVTTEGRVFRPSDWSERLAGAMASFRPKGGGVGARLGYSPYCRPEVVDGVRCVRVSEALKDLEPMAWEFVMNFARDNHLPVADAQAFAGPFGKA